MSLQDNFTYLEFIMNQVEILRKERDRLQALVDEKIRAEAEQKK
jgi:hypothetical protein